MFQRIINHKYFSFINDKNIRILVVVGIIYRLVLSILYFNFTQVPDSGDYTKLAHYLLNFDLSGYNGNRSPGYPMLIALAFGSEKLATLYSFGLGIITSVFWYKTLKNLTFSSQTALFITLFFEGFIHIYFYETSIVVEATALFFISWLVYVLSDNYFEKYTLKTELYVGFIVGYLVLIKPFYAFIPFLIYGYSVLYKFNFKKLISIKLVILIFPLMAYFGWSYVNKVNTGYFVSTSFFGLNIAQNCVYFAEKTEPDYQWIGDVYAKNRDKNLAINDALPADAYPKNMAMTIWDSYEELMAKTDQNFPKLSNELSKYAVATIRKNPKDYMQQVVTRSWFDFWKTSLYWEYLDFRTPYFKTILKGIWSIENIILYILKFGFLILSPILLFRFFKTRKMPFELFLTALILTTSILQALATYGENDRFSYPFEFMMVLVWALFFKDKVEKLQKYLSSYL